MSQSLLAPDAPAGGGPHVRVAIIGTGFGGLGAAVRLLADGVGSLVVFERAHAVGGVWRDNVYPGAACDVESHLYALGAAPNARWSRRFSAQPEIQAYLEDVARTHGVTPHIRFGHDVASAVWDDAAARWRVATSGGDWTADVLVSASGALAEPRFPDLPGLDTFAGTLVHTSRWDPDLDLDGRRVAVVGTGASAVQVVPAIQPRVAHLTLFQRTPAYVIPRRDWAHGRAFHGRPRLLAAARTVLYGRHEALGLAFRHRSLAAVAERLPRWHLARQVADPDLRRRLAADYRFGCKRILLSDTYYPALTRPNVTVTGAAATITPGGLIDAGGTEHAADVIVFATGFHVHDLPIASRITGRAGRTLSETWAGAPQAHVGTTVAGFPNLFVLQGPNTGLGHSSVLLTIEAQVEHIAGALRAMARRGLSAVEPRAEAQAAFVAEVDRRSVGTVWTSGCESWYLDDTGRNAAVWPGSVGAFRRRVAPFRPAEYHLRRLDDSAHTPAPPVPDVPLSLRVRGTAARGLGLLPASAAARLAGAPVETDGQRLDPHVQLLLRLEPRPDAEASFRADPVAARHRLRRDVLAVRGARTPVGRVRDLQVGGATGPLAARLYSPRGVEAPPLVVFFHGGGFVEGDLDTHDEPCRLLCRQAGHAVLSVAYRLAPEHPFPAAVDDAVEAFRWAQAHAERLGADPARVCVAGDSAGGCLAAVVAQITCGDRPPAAQLLIYPATDTPTDRPSRSLFDGYLLPDGLRAAFFDVYMAGTGTDAADPRISPGLAARLDGLAPALVSTAGFDVLRDEGEAYAAALRQAGVPVVLFREPGLPHGFLHLTGAVPAARLAAIATARHWRAFVAEDAA